MLGSRPYATGGTCEIDRDKVRDLANVATWRAGLSAGCKGLGLVPPPRPVPRLI